MAKSMRTDRATPGRSAQCRPHLAGRRLQRRGPHRARHRRAAPSPGTSGRTAPVYDPATGAVTAEVDLASVEEVDAAVAVAVEAQRSWRDSTLGQRAHVLFAVREAVVRHEDDLAAVITAQHGKTLADAAGEVQRGLECIEFACGVPELLKGDFSPQVSGGVDVRSLRQPIGVVGCITPFNFPCMVPLWMVPNAIACGNAVVLKPSERDPGASVLIAELFHDAGLPDGVLNVVHGDQVAVNRILEHPDIGAISFVGSTPVARHVYETGTAHGKRVQALGGAKNHMVVLPDADLDLAADAAVSAAYGSAGERCMAVSVVVAVGDVGDPLVDAVRLRLDKLVIGPGTDPPPRWGRSSPASTATGWRPTSAAATTPAPRSSSTGASTAWTATASSSGHPPRPRHPRHGRVPRRDLRAGALRGAGRLLRRGPRAHQRQPLRQRRRHLHPRRRRRPPVRAGGGGGHGRDQRPDPRARRRLQLRRLAVVAVRRQPHVRPRGRALLHAQQGRHDALARPGHQRRRPRVPAQPLTAGTGHREPAAHRGAS